MRFWVLTLVSFFTLHPCTVTAQASSTLKDASASDAQNADLRYVIYVERHGVRSPTGQMSQYNLYSTGLWPEWNVQPGYLTPHGYHLMELFGTFDRQYLAQQGLLQDHGCADASAVTIYADSDQRTRETGKAIAQGLMPECTLPVVSLPEGTNDLLFHARINTSPSDRVSIAQAAIAGRIGGNPSNLTKAYYNQIAALDHVLATCGASASPNAKRLSLFDVPARLTAGEGDHPAELKGPLNTASTLSENLMLEYAQGMDLADVGWGCVRYPEIEQLMALHTAATDFSQRTPAVAQSPGRKLAQPYPSVTSTGGRTKSDSGRHRQAVRPRFISGWARHESGERCRSSESDVDHRWPAGRYASRWGLRSGTMAKPSWRFLLSEHTLQRRHWTR